MNTHSILTEVRTARDEILRSYGNDVDRLFESVMRRQFESNARVVALDRETGALTKAGGSEPPLPARLTRH